MTSAAREAVLPEIGKYQLIAELARGGMGNVYLAALQGLGGFNKLLVVKELKPDLADDETFVSMFLDEARLAARLIHPNIVQTNEVGSEGKRHFMVMEFLDGRSLYRLKKRLGDRLPVGAHLRVLAESLLGLHHAHDLREFDGAPLGIVHRDVSPLNVFVTFDGQAKVLDFGIAKTADSSLHTATGVVKGRVAYMAPEQAWGNKVDRRADVYSLGVMIWEAAAGRRLWPGLSDVEILARGLRDGVPLLRSVRPDAPADLEAICSRALARECDDRYPTAADLLGDLEDHLATRPDGLTMREIGALAATAFADERRRMASLIERALSRMRAGPRSGIMPTLDADLSGLECDPRSGGEPSGSTSLPRVGTPVLSVPTPVTTLPPSRVVGSDIPSPVATSTAPTLPAPSPKRVSMATAVGGALVAAAIVFAAVYRAPTEPSPPAVAALAAVSTSLPTTVIPASLEPEIAGLSVRASPASAQIAIDGAVVAGNPYRARLPKDARVHHVVVVAEGYEPKVEDVVLRGDLALDLSLERRAASPPAPPARRFMPPPPPAPPPRAAKRAAPAAEPSPPPPPPSTPAPASDVGPAGGHAPLRSIVTANPYGTP